MKDWFYRLFSTILSVMGFAMIICLFFDHDYLYGRWQWMFWLILLLANVCSCVLIGALVKRLFYGANKDPLTGLYNRRCFYDRINKVKKSVKTAVHTSKSTIKTSQAVSKTAAKSAKATRRTVQAAQAAARVAAVTAKMAMKVIAAAIKVILVAVKGMISLITAGSWIAVVVILVICLTGFLLGSGFGIFFSNESSRENTPLMTEAVSQLNEEFSA